MHLDYALRTASRSVELQAEARKPGCRGMLGGGRPGTQISGGSPVHNAVWTEARKRRTVSAWCRCWCRCPWLGVTETELRVCVARHLSSETSSTLAQPSLPANLRCSRNPFLTLSTPPGPNLVGPWLGSPAQPPSPHRLPQPPGASRGGACADWWAAAPLPECTGWRVIEERP